MSANPSKGLGHYCVEILDRMYRADPRPMTIVETGTMFKTDLEPGETDLSARSTYAIASWIGYEGQHLFYSLDADAGHIRTCAARLREDRLGVRHCLGNAADYLALFNEDPRPDFVLLDSDSDAEVILKEFLAVQPLMSFNGIIVVDDAFKHPSVNKFRLVRAYLKAVLEPYYALGNQAAAIPFGPAAQVICQEACARSANER